MKSWTPPTNEMIEKVLRSVKKEVDRQYFFSKLKNPLWVEPLHKRGCFSNPPGVKQLSDGYVQYPSWPELNYLVTIAEELPDQVIEIILSLPKTDNPRVYEYILAIALKLKGKKSAVLLPKIIEYIKLDNPFLVHRYTELVQHWATQGNISEALEIIKFLIPFREDPRTQEKQKLRKREPNSSAALLEPAPLFQPWEYQQILEKGVVSLAEYKPYQIACILIDAIANMIRLGMHQEDFDKGRNEDYSEIWCRRLDKSDRGYQDVKETLVQTLTYVCKQIYDKSQEFIDVLDQTLRKYHWEVFKRLRQHLYGLYPNDQTLSWIREQILDYNDYSRCEYHYEFQLMIRKTSEHFGISLLSQDERKEILKAIFSGPSKEAFREWKGEYYTDEAFQQYQRYFHYMQLRPFAALLSGEERHYFNELEDEAQARAITDDSYSPYGEITGGTVSYRSPKSIEDLESFTDEKLLTYLNNWDEEHQDKDNWLIEINISALAGVFQTLFKEKIVQDGKRLAFWMANRDKIARPVYVAAMLKAMLSFIKEKNFNNMTQWIEFCAWALSHPDSVRVEGQTKPRDESRDHPDWRSSREAVVDFIDACVNKDVEAPISARDDLAKLLQQACNQFDWRLDNDCHVLLDRDDPITEAINNTRSRAIESLVNFGFWIRRQLPEDKVPEVTDILAKRMSDDAEVPLTRPEYALLGRHFFNFCVLNRDWAAQQYKIFFPQKNESIWRDAFGSYICFNRPDKLIFEILQGDFEYAIDNLNILITDENDSRELVDRLGQHLFTYYLWEVYPLRGDKSLLERFYNKTNDDRKYWVQLFNHVGCSLRNSGGRLNKTLTDRVIAFFDWRFEATEPLELRKFTFWLKAECLDPEWRLQSYLKILDLSQGKDAGFSLEVKALNKLLTDHLALVVECFAKITDAIMKHNTQTYISADEAKLILKSGLNAEDPRICENAKRARENLLRIGRFEFMELDI